MVFFISRNLQLEGGGHGEVSANQNKLLMHSKYHAIHHTSAQQEHFYRSANRHQNSVHCQNIAYCPTCRCVFFIFLTKFYYFFQIMWIFFSISDIFVQTFSRLEYPEIFETRARIVRGGGAGLKQICATPPPAPPPSARPKLQIESAYHFKSMALRTSICGVNEKI